MFEINESLLREKLHALHDELLERLGPQALKPVLGENPDKSELAQSYASQERKLAIRDTEHEKLELVEQALERLENGEYGNCLTCGSPIRPARLEALPYAVKCMACQEKDERW